MGRWAAALAPFDQPFGFEGCQALHPCCGALACNMNADGLVKAEDIDGFVDTLFNG